MRENERENYHVILNYSLSGALIYRLVSTHSILEYNLHLNSEYICAKKSVYLCVKMANIMV